MKRVTALWRVVAAAVVTATAMVAIVTFPGSGSPLNAPACAGSATCQVLFGWGDDDSGQVGIGASGDGVLSTTPQQVDTPTTSFLSVAAGGAFSVGVTQGGSLLAWGSNAFGQLGTGTASDTPSASPLSVTAPTGTTFAAVAAGTAHALALTTQGSVYAWGSDSYGQLGNGSTSASASPVLVPLPVPIIAIAAGGSESMALTVSGQLYTWGANDSGQLGDGSNVDSDTPQLVPLDLPSGVTVATTPESIAVGAEFCVIVASDGSLYSWGSDAAGQLGNGAPIDGSVDTDSSSPQLLTDTNGVAFSAVAAGQAHVVALSTNHEVYTWGSNIWGQLGAGLDGAAADEPPPDSSLPVPPLGALETDGNVIGVAAGSTSSYAVDSDGHVWSWGDDYFGQLANGSSGSFQTAAADEPRRIVMPSSVAAAEVVAGPDASSAYFVSGIDQSVSVTGAVPSSVPFGTQISVAPFGQSTSSLPVEAVGASGACHVSGVGVFPVLSGSTPEMCSVALGQPGGAASSGQVYNPAPPITIQFEVTPLTLSLIANDQTAPAGLAPPPLDYRLGGLVDDETKSRATGRAACSTTATDKSPPGTYPITCTIGTLVVPGYTVTTFVAGTLTLFAVNPGYDIIGQDGSVYTETQAGSVAPDVSFAGSLVGQVQNPDIVAAAAAPGGTGYWLADATGDVFALGTAQFFGAAPGTVPSPVVGIAATPDGGGYWLLTSDGSILPFGDAQSFGSLVGVALTAPAVGMAVTPDGKGYWIATADAGVFAFGDAPFFGSGAGRPHGDPVTGIASTPRGRGYWLTTTAGGIYYFGDATFEGGLQFVRLSSPVVAITASPVGHGYWLAAANGTIYAFGSAPYVGSATDPSSPVSALISNGAPS